MVLVLCFGLIGVNLCVCCFLNWNKSVDIFSFCVVLCVCVVFGIGWWWGGYFRVFGVGCCKYCELSDVFFLGKLRLGYRSWGFSLLCWDVVGLLWVVSWRVFCCLCLVFFFGRLGFVFFVVFLVFGCFWGLVVV